MEFVFSGRRKVIASGTVRATAAQEALFEGDGEGRTLATLVLDCLERYALARVSALPSEFYRAYLLFSLLDDPSWR